MAGKAPALGKPLNKMVPSLLSLSVSPVNPDLLGPTLLKFSGWEPPSCLPFLLGLVEQSAHWVLSVF